MIISISYLKPLQEACNITSVNHVTSEQECLVPEREQRHLLMSFTKVVSKLSWRPNFVIIKKTLDSTTTAFEECCRTFRGLHLI